MSTINRLISTIRKKIVKPKVYALEMDCGILEYLYIGTAYSLEEAIGKAKLQFLKDPQNRQIAISAWRLRKYVFRELEELVNECMKLENTPGEEILDKNTLMKKIIDEKNITLFHDNLSIFNEYEKKLLNDKLTIETLEKSSRKKI